MEGIEVEVSDFFGWIRKKKWFPLKGRVLVFPKTSDIQFVPIDTHYDRANCVTFEHCQRYNDGDKCAKLSVRVIG